MGYSIEKQPELQAFVRGKFRAVHVWSNLLTVPIKDIANKAANCAGIFLAGGPPCTPFSCLGKQDTFASTEAKPLLAFVDLRQQLQNLCRERTMQFAWLMEEVATVPSEARDAISGLLKSTPFLLLSLIHISEPTRPY